ncbi:uncharacterized protein PAC_13010 [Phialocephala subalpina]|uniref:Uncharacterized protein n=1 Tax=Phialocephala subalpina TaxID=576137 RepID=A0A1L7XDM0_9HELO|nr:uncharacterized protein PAC_13010 [Phialocephala subalpina]
MATWNYDCLKTPFRAEAKMVGCQDARWKPDLFVQMETGSFQSGIEEMRRTMPGHVLISEYLQDDSLPQSHPFLGEKLQQALKAWNLSRFENSRSCYSSLPVWTTRLSEIWHEDFNVLINNPVRDNGKQDGKILGISNPLFLEFGALSTSALISSSSFPKLLPKAHRFDFLFSIEWLNTGSTYGMLRHRVRYGYNDPALKIVRKYSEERRRVDLVLMAMADIKQTFRGGQHDKGKSFEVKERAVIMRIVWDKKECVGERVAVGYCDPVD